MTGDIAGNIERISQAVRRAGKVDLCVTPELALSGVAPGDFLSMNDFVEGCRKGLDILAARFVSGPDLLVGAPVVSVYEPSLLSNAAVYIHRGQWDVISRKVRPEASRDPDAEFFDRGVSLGIVNLAGWRLGIVLCEEDSNSSFWTVRGTGYMPLLDLISRGVDAIIHMRATPYVIGKRADHEAMLTHVAARHHIHLLSERVSLLDGPGEAIQDDASLGTGDLLLHEADDEVVGDEGSSVHVRLGLLSEFGAVPDGLAQHVAGGEPGVAELLAQLLSLGPFSGSRGSEKNDYGFHGCGEHVPIFILRSGEGSIPGPGAA